MNLYFDLCTDILFGFRENLKMKWKILLEMIALTEEIYFKKYESTKERYKLLNLHTHIKLLECFGEKTEISKNLAYKLFNDKNKTNMDYNLFSKYYIKTLGFLMNCEGKTPTLKKISYETIDKNVPNVEISNGVTLNSILNISYDESQLLSHATGYLYFSNTGAWSEDFNIMIAFDNLTLYFLKKLYLLYKVFREDDDSKGYKTMLNVLRNGIKNFESAIERKKPIYNIKRVDKSSYLKIYNEYFKF